MKGQDEQDLKAVAGAAYDHAHPELLGEFVQVPALGEVMAVG